MKTWLTIFISLYFVSSLFARDLQKEVNLNGYWKIQIGDDQQYANPNYDDSSWESVRVPGKWEDRGFPGYDGYAWYRTTVEIGEELRDKKLYIDLGNIDDVDRVYLNGHFIEGRGVFPPELEKAYNVWRLYFIPNKYINFGKNNVIAVQVYDEEGPGGIVTGNIGIYSEFTINLQMDLSGKWSFNFGDEDEWSDKNYNDSNWKKFDVPANWDSQGYEDYDGYGWYRKGINISKNLKDEKLILVLGKIDDIDEVYFNGKRIGRTGRFPGEQYITRNNSYYNRERYYFIPERLIKYNKENVIAVRVFDVWKYGGIYEGPVGIATKDDYMEYKRIRRKNFRFNGENNGFFDVIDEIVNAIDDIF